MNISNLTKKKVIIVGAGVSGLTAGIYCLDNGFDVEIYEKHSIPGGECTGWMRQGQYIDGCAHWIVGTNPTSELYPLWQHIGLFDDGAKTFKTEYITKYMLDDGRIFTFYSDLKKLEQEMLFFFPEDRRNIRNFISTVKAYHSISVPCRKPLDYMNPFEFTLFGLRMLPAAYPFLHYKHVSVEEYVSTFHNKELGEIITRFMEPNYNIHSFFYVCAAVSKDNAGMVEGGSLELMKKVARKFTRMGGKLFLNAPVKKILIKRDNAQGIILENGKEIQADYVIAACDAYHTLNVLLEGKYKDESFESQFRDAKANPINTSIMIAFKTKRNMNNFPKMMDYKIDPIDVFGKRTNHFGIRNFAFDKSLASFHDDTLLTVLLPANEEVYDYLSSLPKDEYHRQKTALGNTFLQLMKEKLNLKDGEIQLLDVTTPLTYERYTNAYKGSYMSFITTKFTKGLMRPGLIKGLRSFVIAGQWIMPPGGLPIALISGKHACQRLCRIDGRKFVNKEERPLPRKLPVKKPQTI